MGTIVAGCSCTRRVGRCSCSVWSWVFGDSNIVLLLPSRWHLWCCCTLKDWVFGDSNILYCYFHHTGAGGDVLAVVEVECLKIRTSSCYFHVLCNMKYSRKLFRLVAGVPNSRWFEWLDMSDEEMLIMFSGERFSELGTLNLKSHPKLQLYWD